MKRTLVWLTLPFAFLALQACQHNGTRDNATGDAGRCCPIDPDPGCDCHHFGGSRSRGGDCPRVCDQAPVGLVRSTDENGCPIVLQLSTESCHPGLPPDAGPDASDANADASDANADASDANRESI